MNSMEHAIESKHTVISEFLASDIEKIYLIVGKDRHLVRRMMDGGILRAAEKDGHLVYRYEIWEEEHSRHFLFRWLQETANGKALFDFKAHADAIGGDEALSHTLGLLVEKDIRPLEIRFMEAIRFISRTLSPNQRMILSIVPRAEMSDTILVEFFRAMLSVMPVNVKMLVGQDRDDVIAKQTDFAPSSRLIIDDLKDDVAADIANRYQDHLDSEGVRGRLIRLLAHLVHPVELPLLSLITGETEETIAQELSSDTVQGLVEPCGDDCFRLALQFRKDAPVKTDVDAASVDKTVVEYFEKRLLTDGFAYSDALYHSLGLSRMDQPEMIGRQTLSTLRGKLDAGGADMCEYELSRALKLIGDTNDLLKVDLMMALGEIQESRKRNQEALDTLNPAIDMLKLMADASRLQQAFELKGRASFSMRDMETAKEAMAQSLKLSEEMDRPELEADILSQLGYIHFSSQQLQEAETYYRRALDLYQRYSETNASAGLVGQASQWSNLGHTLYAKGAFDSAETYHRKALEIYEELEDHKARANQWGYIGHTFFAAKEFEKANAAYEKAAELEEEMGAHRQAAQRHANLGHSMYAQRKVELAEQSFEKALAKYRELGDAEGEAAQLSNLGIAKGDQGEFDQAIDYFDQSARIYTVINDTISAASQVVKKGHVCRAQKQYDTAVEHYRDALGRFKEMNYPMGEGNTELDLGQLYMEKKEWETAVDCFGRAKDLFAKIGHGEKESLSLVLTGQAEQARGQGDAALEAYRTAEETYKKAENPIGAANVACQMGLLQYERKNFGEAERLYQEALQIFQEKQDKEGEANLLSNLGTLYFETNEVGKAQEYFQKALSMLRSMGHPFGMVGVLQNLSYAFEKEGKYAEAHECLTEARELFERLEMQKEAADVGEHLSRLEEKAGRSLENMRSELFPGISDANGKTEKKGRAKIGRNDPCPCGSGKKYKKCCGA